MNFDFLKDSSPYSTMRVLAFGIGFPFGIFFACSWLYLTIVRTQLQDVPATVMDFLLVVFGAKVAQKMVEGVVDVMKKKKEENADDTSETNS